MKEIYIADIKAGEDMQGYFMVKSIAVKTGSNKKNYLDIMLGDGTGEIPGKKWNLADEEVESARHIEPGEVVKVRGQGTEWNGMRQLKLTRIRKTGAEDDIDLADYIRTAPEPSEEMYEYIVGVAEDMDDAELKALCLLNLRENKDRLMYYPAAQKNHHAERGGLLWHTKRMLMTGQQICTVYNNLNPDMVSAGVILHDMQKLNEINSDTRGISDGYSFEGLMLGHLVMGVKILARQMEDLGFSEEKSVMVEHMILSHHYHPEFGSPKMPLFPEAEILHYLDIIDARMYDMDEALRTTEPGQFSERVRTLDNRRLYKTGGTK